MDKPVALAADHGGYELKNSIKEYLNAKGIPTEDFGVHTPDSVDYPDVVKAPMQAVLDGHCRCAILFCGTGVGISMAANKLHGVRACCCSDTFSAELTRRHNDANALCLGGRVVGAGLAAKLVDVFLETEFEGGRHQQRVDKITALDKER